uniref:O-antigen polymerase n=1 Tax=Yersinia similis TaxID=367190 RepID=S0F3C2_9GAMM|nr:O-antigen polymerase [Yersinia similis]
MVNKKNLKIIFISLFFLCAYHLSYIYYIYPQFSYAGYSYHPSGITIILLAYFCSLFPLFFYKSIMTPSNYGLSLIYTFCFAPSLLTLSFQWNQDVVLLAILLIMLSISMSLLFSSVFGKKVPVHGGNHRNLKSNLSKVYIHFLTIISIAFLLNDNFGHMRFVSFYDVYALRFEARDATSSILSGYMTMWLSTCFIPYYATVGILNKNLKFIGVSIFLAVLIYMANGSKSTLLLPFVIFSMAMILSIRRIDFLIVIITLMTSAIFILLCLDIPSLKMTKAIFFMRTLATSGWTLVTYYDYFSQHGYTYFSHIGIVNHLTGLYPYGDFSLGQMIGLEHSGSSDANFNANFWASDGLAALGIIGIIPATFFMMLVVYLIDRLAVDYRPEFVALWLTGFWISVTNAPITTSLLSGGAIWVLFLLNCNTNINFNKNIIESKR